MKKLLFLILTSTFASTLTAQRPYQIVADSILMYSGTSNGAGLRINTSTFVGKTGIKTNKLFIKNGTADTALVLYDDATGQGAIDFRNGYVGTLTPGTLTAQHVWILPNKSGTILLDTDTASLSSRINQRWALTGNTGTDSATNYIGTTDAKPFSLITNGILRGIISSTGNWGIGRTTASYKLDVAGSVRIDSGLYLNSSTAGVGGDIFKGGLRWLHNGGATSNIYLGWLTGSKSVNSGGNNIGIGQSTTAGITTGGKNAAVGGVAGRYITTGSNNSLFGYQAGGALNTGGNNSLFGYQAGQLVTTGSNNIMLGYQAGYWTDLSNRFIVSNRQMFDAARDTTSSFMSGYIDPNSPVDSRLTLNTKLIAPYTPSGAGVYALRIDGSGNITKSDTFTTSGSGTTIYTGNGRYSTTGERTISQAGYGIGFDSGYFKVRDTATSATGALYGGNYTLNKSGIDFINYDSLTTSGIYSLGSYISLYNKDRNNLDTASEIKLSPDLTFKTANTSRMIVTNAGNVGIGTTTPVYKFDVNGDINFSGNLYKGGVLYTGSNISNASLTANSNYTQNWNGNQLTFDSISNLSINVKNGTGSQNSLMAASASGTYLYANNQYILLSDASSTTIRAAGTNVLLGNTSSTTLSAPFGTILYSTGLKTGFGTSSPISKFHFNGTIRVTDSLVLSGIATGIPSGAKRLLIDANGNVYKTDTTVGNAGTVTSVATGYGLSGGTITSTGTLIADSSVLMTKGTTQVVSGNKYHTGNIILSTAGTTDGSVATINGTQTLTNKRWTARVGSTTSSATPTINTDNTDIYKLTAQAADITSFTTNLSGTPVDGDILEIQVTGTAARAITWGASFVSSTVALPTTTVTTATLTIIFQYYTTSSYGNNKWICVNYY